MKHDCFYPCTLLPWRYELFQWLYKCYQSIGINHVLASHRKVAFLVTKRKFSSCIQMVDFSSCYLLCENQKSSTMIETSSWATPTLTNHVCIKFIVKLTIRNGWCWLLPSIQLHVMVHTTNNIQQHRLLFFDLFHRRINGKITALPY